MASAQHETVLLRIHSRKRARVPCASDKGIDAGSAFFPKGAPGLHGVASQLCVMTRLPGSLLTVGSFLATILKGRWPLQMLALELNEYF